MSSQAQFEATLSMVKKVTEVLSGKKIDKIDKKASSEVNSWHFC